MQTLTLRVIQGADRGKVFSELRPPISIGREEGNSIQLNDERVSRFHLKIQEDNNHLVLTDLESTNGTRVNGQDCQMRILRYGDIVAVGRSVLLVGTRDQIANRIHNSVGKIDSNRTESISVLDQFSMADFDMSTGMESSYRLLLSHQPTPSLPERMTPSQSAQFAEILDYFHQRFAGIIDSAKVSEQGDQATLDGETWQVLLQSFSRLSEYMRALGDPDFKLSD